MLTRGTAARTGRATPAGTTRPASRWRAVPGRLARALCPADRAAVVVLLAVPALLFGIPALFGHVLVPTDDLDQNFPLRVLVGEDLRSGRWPVINPYVWSGSPLLGVWNAGAAYPFTWLFAVTPPIGAWVLNEIVAYATCGLGLYAFCRNERLRPLPALLAALSFTVGGAFAAHLGHIGLVAGVSWIPLMMLALARLSAPVPPGSWRVRLRWTVVLGVAGGLCVLAGEPRAVTTAALVAGGYGLWRLARCRPVRRAFAASAVAGAGLAVLLGAVQWAPGLAAVATSQRAEGTYDLFARGSLPIRWLSLVAMPTLLGGSGSLHLPRYFATYNLPEVASYVGLLPLVAAAAMLGRLPLWHRLGRLRRSGRAVRPDDSDPAARGWPEWLVWHLLGGIGAVLALGANTPLGPILHRVPLFGDQRLQSRNIMIADLALAVLLGYWADGWLRRRARGRAPTAERVLAGLTLVGVATLAAMGLVRGPGLARHLHVDPAAAGRARDLWPAFAGSLVLAGAVAVLLAVGPRLRGRVRAGILLAVVCVDLAGYLAVAGAPAPVPATADTVAAMPDPPARFADVGRDGRFAVYGPRGVRSLRMGGIGITDLNMLAHRYSMQGYTAIVDGRYAAATGTHLPSGGGHNTLSVATISNGTLDQLATRYLLTPTNYLSTDVTGAVGGPTATGAARIGDDGRVRTVGPGRSASWYLGGTLRVAAVSLRADTVPTGSVQVGLLGEDGTVHWLAGPTPVPDSTPPALVARNGEPDGTAAVGVVVRNTDGQAVQVADPTVHASDGRAYVVGMVPQDLLLDRGWTFTGVLDGYAVFTNPHAAPPLSLQPLPGGSLAGATVRRTAGEELWPTAARVSSPDGVVVLRAAAAIPGWTATWTPEGGGPVQSLPVTRHGVVQATRVPAGTGVLSWHYRAPGLALGAALGAAGAVLTAGLLLVAALPVRRRRSDRRPPTLERPESP